MIEMYYINVTYPKNTIFNLKIQIFIKITTFQKTNKNDSNTRKAIKHDVKNKSSGHAAEYGGIGYKDSEIGHVKT